MNLCGFEVGLKHPLFAILGPCVIESRNFALETAHAIGEMAAQLALPVVYKASYDKANRTAASSPRGPGIEEGLSILQEVREQTGLPVLTDVHSPEEARLAATVVDVLQIPAFLCRQTDLIVAAAGTGKAVNIKKGQILAQWDMRHAVAKAKTAQKNAPVLVCERGTSFGYNNLVVDMRSIAILRETGCPVVFDATHAVQLPGGQGTSSGGERHFVPLLARAAVAAGVAGLFLETHPDPDHAWSDGPNAWPLQPLHHLLEELMDIDRLVKTQHILEDNHDNHC
jgi:2-dehydro-3-deoxyphosphooctonate aldolase (KDO 8-P synthase)